MPTTTAPAPIKADVYAYFVPTGCIPTVAWRSDGAAVDGITRTRPRGWVPSTRYADAAAIKSAPDVAQVPAERVLAMVGRWQGKDK